MSNFSAAKAHAAVMTSLQRMEHRQKRIETRLCRFIEESGFEEVLHEREGEFEPVSYDD